MHEIKYEPSKIRTTSPKLSFTFYEEILVLVCVKKQF